MNTVKDDWEDDDDLPQLTQSEQMKLDARAKEEDADHELTEDLFALNKQPKEPVVIPKPVQEGTLFKKPQPAKPKQREHVSKKEDNERKIKEKVAVKKKVAENKQKHAAVFGDAELDLLQDEYCDYEDRY
jgi:outer membrane biosynthesis protein TonB